MWSSLEGYDNFLLVCLSLWTVSAAPAASTDGRRVPGVLSGSSGPSRVVF